MQFLPKGVLDGRNISKAKFLIIAAFWILFGYITGFLFSAKFVEPRTTFTGENYPVLFAIQEEGPVSSLLGKIYRPCIVFFDRAKRFRHDREALHELEIGPLPSGWRHLWSKCSWFVVVFFGAFFLCTAILGMYVVAIVKKGSADRSPINP